MTMPPPREAAVPTDERPWEKLLTKIGDSAAFPPSERPRTAVRELRPGHQCPRRARDATRSTLGEWNLGGLCDDAAVVVSELVTNAIRHGLRHDAAPAAERLIRLVLLGYPRHLVCMVADPGKGTPTIQEPDYVAETGRGLHIVEAMSRAWGWTPLGAAGKAVWATFPIA